MIHARYAGGASTPGTTELDILDGKLIRLYKGTAYSGGAAWMTFCHTSLTLIEIDYTVLDGAQLTYAKSRTEVGTGTGGSLPSECAIVMTIRTATRGRRTRGRIYLPAPTVTYTTTSGLFTQTYVDNAVAQITGLQADLASSQWSLGVASYGEGTLNGVPRTWTPFFTDANSFTMDQKIDVQRRRK